MKLLTAGQSNLFGSAVSSVVTPFKIGEPTRQVSALANRQVRALLEAPVFWWIARLQFVSHTSGMVGSKSVLIVHGKIEQSTSVTLANRMWRCSADTGQDQMSREVMRQNKLGMPALVWHSERHVLVAFRRGVMSVVISL